MRNEISNELRDLHAARFAEIAALREMLVCAENGSGDQLDGDVAGKMRNAVIDILRLQKCITRLGE